MSRSLAGDEVVPTVHGDQRLAAKRRHVNPFSIARPLLHRLGPESAHELTLRALELGLVPPQPVVDEPRLAIDLFGRRLAHPIGLAAGFDKNARVYRQMLSQGFALVEIGGVTPRPQRGNPRPRVFRLAEDRAVINRMGFPGEGADVVAARLAGLPSSGMFGVNLASNADSADPAADFVALVARFAPLADYLTLDVSCPNTTNGQVFLDPGALRDLLARLAAVQLGSRRPVLVAKLSPDIDDARLASLITVLLEAKIDGIAVGNTTAQRPALRGNGAERGGLSGKPLFPLALATLSQVDTLVGGAVPLIGIGGVASGADAYAMIRAGATAIQLYTALIYGGTDLVTRIKRELAVFLMRDDYSSVGDATAAHRRGTRSYA
jgi:dihydroorotate dehydrogenase